MLRTASSKLSLAAVATLATAGLAQAIPVYSLLTERVPFVGDRSQPVAAGTSIYDDVNIQDALLGANTAIRLDQVKVGILRDPGAPATTLTLSVAETNPGVGSGFPSVVLPSTPIGTIAMPAFAGVVADVEVFDIIFAPGTGPIVNLEFGDQPGYGQFAVGVAFSNADPKNTWAIHDYVGTQLFLNLDGAWENDGTAFSIDLPGTPPVPVYTTFMLGIDATPVPEPAALSLLALGVVPMLRRRRA